MGLPDSVTRRRAILGGVGTVVTGSGIVYGASALGSSRATAVTTQFHASSETTGFGIDLQGHPIMGALDAPIDMYYWSDYQCPFCRRFEDNALPKLIEKQVQTGTVRVVFIEFPYLSAGSMTAAAMDRCVWREVRTDSPQAYWRWHSTLFDKQGSKNSGWATRENLLEITADVDGVNASAVESCLNTHRSDIETWQGNAQLMPPWLYVDHGQNQNGGLHGARPGRNVRLRYHPADEREVIDVVADTCREYWSHCRAIRIAPRARRMRDRCRVACRRCGSHGCSRGDSHRLSNGRTGSDA
jgi:hypothetical protein